MEPPKQGAAIMNRPSGDWCWYLLLRNQLTIPPDPPPPPHQLLVATTQLVGGTTVALPRAAAEKAERDAWKTVEGTHKYFMGE